MKKVIKIWYDSKGKKQYVYHPDYVKKKSQQKYSKILKQIKLFEKIYKNILIDLKSNDQHNKQIAIILYLMIKCGFRVGNKYYEKHYNSYGISTIKMKHIKLIEPNIIQFDFIGKKGVRNYDTCNNKIIYNFFQEILKKYNKEEKIFLKITSKDVNRYLNKYGKGDISSKDLRTWMANMLFIQFCAKNIKLKKKNIIKDSIECVSKKLHNTPAICKKSYIDINIINCIERKIKKMII